MVVKLKEKLSLLPDAPGCYLMKDKDGHVLYVGKAKSLKNRVRSYFTGSHDGKTERLVQEIADFEIIVTRSAFESLILEMNLIKEHQPRYNVLLKDDKSYPYIKLTKERHPRLEITRRVKKGDGHYFGPYPDATAARETKRLLDRLYPLRKCRTLPAKACLYYHLGQCLAPCIRPVEPEEYAAIEKEIKAFLRGGHGDVKEKLAADMRRAAERWDFERAAELRDLIRRIDAVMEKQSVLLPDAADRDIFGYAEKNGLLSVQVLHMRGGRLIERKSDLRPLSVPAEEAFFSYVAQFYAAFDRDSWPDEILLPPAAGPEGEAALEALEAFLERRVKIPKRGAGRDLVRMAEKNAALALDEHLALRARDDEKLRSALAELGAALGLRPPERIEAFDIAHLGGADAVGAMVAFVGGRPDKTAYRKYRLKEARGGDDPGALREVVRRRFIRLLKEGAPHPDLVLVDGGRAQVEAAVDVLRHELGLSLPVAGMVKDERHRTAGLLFGDPPAPVALPRSGEAFVLIARIQEEVHRFAQAYHHAVRRSSALASLLDGVPGIGPKRKRALLMHFGSLRRLRAADPEEIRRLIGRPAAEALRERLQALDAGGAASGETPEERSWPDRSSGAGTAPKPSGGLDDSGVDAEAGGEIEAAVESADGGARAADRVAEGPPLG
ncbi:MAG: excinuclease ABC subunit UvrC [Hydrogenibacillus schlegelii]|nr:excinuclease ABC subunit UvrC [Hydrogenibacillus schlegelii]